MAHDDKKPLETGTCCPLVLPFFRTDNNEVRTKAGNGNVALPTHKSRAQSSATNECLHPRYFALVALPETEIIHGWRMNDRPAHTTHLIHNCNSICINLYVYVYIHMYIHISINGRSWFGWQFNLQRLLMHRTKVT